MDAITETNIDLYCYGCGSEAEGASAHTCPSCGEPMSLRSLARPSADVFQSRPESMWAYFDLLPIRDRANVISLREGSTPLIDAPRLARRHGIRNIILKNETANPTGSFKDRQVSVGVSRARELGLDTVAVVSSGNVACAASAYAARAGMRAILLMHRHAAESKCLQAAVYGGTVLRVNTPSASALFELCIQTCREFGWYHLSTAGMYEPYNVEGAKTLAYEMYQQTGGDLPDWIVVSVGGGGLLGGIWRGLLDLQRLDLIDLLPRLVGVQPEGCAPLPKAIADNTKYLDTLKTPWQNPQTIAGGLADDILFDGHTALPAIRTTGGAAVAVSDEEILEAEKRLAESEGILCEPSSAVAIAALEHLPDDARSGSVCCIVTGSGIKDLHALHGRVREPLKTDASLEAIAAAVEGGA